ncbi:hypothetical protein [Suttonella ornithocola]|uniref:Uncharacterized protein n=1 Tax=Suttonella ornithocola TaxID=279832 RepID=A0A380MMN7_9GAMM|nr:hypothetical protein [Suttonella ornithocola]SUO93880.1 Uncharacterised protein [Suttonella ornithocola]
MTADEANAHSITASVDIPSSQDGTVVVKASVTATATGNTPAANSAQDDVIVDTGRAGRRQRRQNPNGADNDSTTQDGAPKVSIKDGGDNALNPTDLDSGKPQQRSAFQPTPKPATA